jgi:hypothetical protein
MHAHAPSSPPDAGRRRTWAPAVVVLASVALHVALLPWVLAWLSGAGAPMDAPPVTVHMVQDDPERALTPEQARRLRDLEAQLAPEAPPPPEPVAVPPPPPVRGQVVETVRPDVPRTPVTAEYLAEHDAAVPVETRSERFKVNPDVLSNAYSEQSRLALEELLDVGATEMSTGAMAGSLAEAAPGAGSPSSPVRSPWARTNKEGLAAPLPASSTTQAIAGAPQNDRVDERAGDVLALNTRAFIGAAYINRIKRMVNVYWSQQLDNLPGNTRLVRPRYETVVDVVLDGKGALVAVTVRDASGVEALDLCVTRAFALAAPFPNPPAALVADDGQVHLSGLAFEVVLGRPRLNYGGVDPRAGVLFPGIQKSLR